jgi:transmembrane sensor
MVEENRDIFEVISSVLNGSATSEEKQLLENWINESEGNRKTFESFSRLGYVGNMDRSVFAKRHVYDKVMNKIMIYRNRKKIQLWQYLAAASVLLLFITGTWLFVRISSNDNKVSVIETQNSLGIKSKITLSDGTVVYLNTGSRITYPSRFTGNKRLVNLTGEAYFEVAKDKEHPFIVKTDSLSIQVMGTHFDVKAYNEDDEITATLAEGSISISGNCLSSIVMKPDQQLVYMKKDGKFLIRMVDAKSYSTWKDGEFYFEKENFPDIARKLEREFNITINIKSDALRKEIFSGEIEKGKNINQILDIMKRHRHFNYKIERDTITIFEEY